MPCGKLGDVNDSLILILFIALGVIVLGGLAFVLLKGPKAPKGGYPETREPDDVAAEEQAPAGPRYETPAPVAGRLVRLRQRRAAGAGVGIHLEASSAEAVPFYARLGFTECGRITDYPPGHDRIFYVKRFDDGGTAAVPPP